MEGLWMLKITKIGVKKFLLNFENARKNIMKSANRKPQLKVKIEDQSIYLSIHLSIYLSIYLSRYLRYDLPGQVTYLLDLEYVPTGALPTHVYFLPLYPPPRRTVRRCVKNFFLWVEGQVY